MPATLSRDDQWSLWSKAPGGWYLMDTNPDRDALVLKAASLRTLFTNRRFIVAQGPTPPAL